MSITVQRLHKLLGQLAEQGHGRKPVCVDKESFSSPLENDGVSVFDLEIVDGPRWIEMADDDGGTKWNKDGSASGRTVVILKGGAG
ncbi:hypothetical protein C6P61_09585 [Malikia spinosa]|uniref:Uncharacterized protein n=1 Tax=Malikia spinosa TaxID=86180 RepID=A0A2S9KE78_9BURK|nr:hypothetical protein [Malikia spinosa]PRD68743.1 hypothetical protein C6P61_09585 [Malikia spinosa]